MMTKTITEIAKETKYYAESLDKHRRQRRAYFESLRSARLGCSDFDDFIPWLEQSYGIQVNLDSFGMITDSYDIVDEQKYLIFLLKYGK
jgi:hypothetical protein